MSDDDDDGKEGEVVPAGQADLDVIDRLGINGGRLTFEKRWRVGQGRKNPNRLRPVCPPVGFALCARCKLLAHSRTISMALIQSLGTIHKKAPLKARLFCVWCPGVESNH